MMNRANLILSTSPKSQPSAKPSRATSLNRRQRLIYGRSRRKHTGKEQDSETGLYYFGARYLDSKTGRWISGDPALGDYVPSAPVDDEAKKRNQSLPGMGGVFNYVNLHVYHYAGNNPVKYRDPTGKDFFNFTQENITVFDENTNHVTVLPGEMYEGAIDGAMLGDGTIIKVTHDAERSLPIVDVAVGSVNGEDTAFITGLGSIVSNTLGDLGKSILNIFNENDLLSSGVYSPEAVERNPSLGEWRDSVGIDDRRGDQTKVREMTIFNINPVLASTRGKLKGRE